jgi:hypothetical protein
MAFDKAHAPSDTQKSLQSSPGDHHAALHESASFNKASGTVNNQAWAEMTGNKFRSAGAHPGDGPNQAHGISDGRPTYGNQGDHPNGMGGPGANASAVGMGSDHSIHYKDGAEAHDQGHLDQGLSAESTNALYCTWKNDGNKNNFDLNDIDGPPNHNDGPPNHHDGPPSIIIGADKSGGDKGSDGSDNKLVGTRPQIDTPTPEQLANAPLEQLQGMSRHARQKLDNYVAQNGGNIPQLAFHGTNESSANALMNDPRGGEIWVAGPSPNRAGADPSQHVGDIGQSIQTSLGYAEKRGQSGDHKPGPVLVYDAGNQPEAWAKNNYSSTGSAIEGGSPSDVAKFGQIDVGKANLIGAIPREQIDASKQKFAQMDAALKAKQSALMSQPGGMSAAQQKDLLARVQVMNELQRAHQVGMVLDAISPPTEL